MFAFRSSPVPLVAALAAAATLASLLRLRAEELRPPAVEMVLDVPALPANVARPFSFGFGSMLADLTFLQAIQVHGARKAGTTAAAEAPRDRLLEKLLDYTVEIDPHFDGAYRFAGSALPRHTSDGKAMGVLAAERILQQGEREHLGDWRIPFELGFLQSFYLGHFDAAAQSMARAAELPGAPRYVGFLATRLAADAGSLDMGEKLAAAMEAEATEEATREAWHQRMLDLRMERHLREIEAAAARYRARTGRPADSLETLVREGDLRAIPDEPHGGRYQLLANGEGYSTAAPRLRVRGRAGTTSGLLAQ